MKSKAARVLIVDDEPPIVDLLVYNLERANYDVVVAREYKYMCSDPGQEMIKRDIKDENLTRVVVASCSRWGPACSTALA